MATSVTNNLRKFLFQLLKDDIDNGVNTYYVGISRSEVFTPGTDIASVEEQKKARHAIQAVKTASNVSFVVPNNPWISGTVYNSYDDNDQDQENFYVINSNREVFVCVQQAIDEQGNALQSTVEPTGSLASFQAKTFKTIDGYFWRFIMTVSSLAASNYTTNNWIPVKTVTSVTNINEEVQQLALQDSAVPGELLRVEIDSAGLGLSEIPTLSVVGNGSSAQFVATINQGKVTRVLVDSDDFGNYYHGTNYDYAQVKGLTGNASFRPIYAPVGGLNADPVKTLKSRSLMIETEFAGNEANTILPQNDFVQYILMKDVKKFGSDSDFSGNTGLGLKSFIVSAASGTFTEDATINNATNTAFAKVFYHDTFANTLYYYQDDETGFDAFTNGQQISDGSVTAIVDSQNDPDFNRYSGEILLINNLSEAVDRVSNQTEDIRIVLTLD